MPIKKILLPSVLGGVALFIWGSLSHMVLGIGEASIKQIPNEDVVLASMRNNITEHGFYFFPGYEQSPDMTDEQQEDFFEVNHDLDKSDENLIRIIKVLKLMDRAFGKDAAIISSRAVAVSGYLFVEELVKNKGPNQVRKFSQFYSKLLDEIKHNTNLLSQYQKPSNPTLMEEFQKHVLQASVEAYSIKRRHEYLKKALAFYLDSKTKGKIIGAK